MSAISFTQQMIFISLSDMALWELPTLVGTLSSRSQFPKTMILHLSLIQSRHVIEVVVSILEVTISHSYHLLHKI